MEQPWNNKGGGTPVVHDNHRLLVHSCRRPRGGDKTIASPGYTMIVNNPGEGVLDLFEDENGIVVVDDALESLILNQ